MGLGLGSPLIPQAHPPPLWLASLSLSYPYDLGLNLSDLSFPRLRVVELCFFLALPVRILEVKPQDQGRVLELEGLTAGCVILSQMLTFRCLVCSMGMPSESHLPGSGMT